MERGELYITVPSVFRCPISMDIMKSPVSLCTGVTYDRSSIQLWLDSGHETCPATMQILPSKDFVPNLTLRRLINVWNQSSVRLSDPHFSPQPKVSLWIQTIEARKQGFLESLVKIVEFVSLSEHNRRFLVSFNGFVEVIVRTLNQECSEVRVLELIVTVLDLILVENGVREKLHKLVFNGNTECLIFFVSVLRKGDPKSKIEAIRVLESILLDNESRRIVAETPKLIPNLIDVLESQNDRDLKDTVLSLLILIAMNRTIKTQLVQLGLVKLLAATLSDQSAAVSTVEKSLKLLSMACTCSGDGRTAIREEPKCVTGIMERLMKVSKTAREDAVLVLWSMCFVFRDGRVQDKVVRNNGITKLLLVMQSEGEGNVRKMSGDLVKVLRVGSKMNGGDFGGALGRYETNTTHIMPC
ncbi:hypothetical protein K2173_023090 [Erythroxylum novogranatense]|uniref:U-box domain-containing protein n=1 Tax=Erythroxylum novogranatense TaxID=1862640 RepID=A0AAV8T9I8_9ROSI|nr:hypothetical protein K2173_023090 [Erythroxylum novogranatense]